MPEPIATVQTLDDFFTHWVRRHNVVATVEGGLKFEEAKRAWSVIKVDIRCAREEIQQLQRTVEQLQQAANYHEAMHHKYVTAYQQSRCKNVGDYTRMFVRRKRMRPLIRFLLSA